MNYRGYDVIPYIFQYANEGGLHDEGFILDAPCGCMTCQEEVQAGHSQCFSYPKWMDDDANIYPRLANGGWVWELLVLEGDDSHD